MCFVIFISSNDILFLLFSHYRTLSDVWLKVSQSPSGHHRGRTHHLLLFLSSYPSVTTPATNFLEHVAAGRTSSSSSSDLVVFLLKNSSSKKNRHHLHQFLKVDLFCFHDDQKSSTIWFDTVRRKRLTIKLFWIFIRDYDWNLAIYLLKRNHGWSTWFVGSSGCYGVGHVVVAVPSGAACGRLLARYLVPPGYLFVSV